MSDHRDSYQAEYERGELNQSQSAPAYEYDPNAPIDQSAVIGSAAAGPSAESASTNPNLVRKSQAERFKNSPRPPPFTAKIEGFETVSNFPRNYVAFKVVLIAKPVEEKLGENDGGWNEYHGVSLTQVAPVRHRYSDFEALRTHLFKLFPGVFVPPLPPKQYLNILGDDSAFVGQRQRDLERFLNRLLEVDVLRDSVALQKFFQIDVTQFDSVKKEFEAEAERFELLAAYQRRYLDIIYEYQTMDIDPNYFVKIKKSLDELKSLFSRLRDAADTLSSRFKDFNQAVTLLSSNVALTQPILDSFEILAKNEHGPVKFYRIDPTSTFKAWAEQNANSSQQYDIYIRDALRHELEDVDTLLELIERRNYIHGMQVRAANNAKKWSSVSNPSDKQREEKDKDLSKEMKLRNIEQAISAILVLKEIPTIIQNSQAAYKVSLHALATGQVVTSETMTKNWSELQAMTRP